MKGQSEMMGLMIIVILIIFIGLVFLRFSFSERNSLPELRENIQASNLLSSIIKYDTQEGSIKDLIVRCVRNKECGTLEGEVKEIMKNSLDTRTKYEFSVIAKDEGDKEALRMGSCNQGIASNTQVSQEGLYIEVRLKLC